MRANIKKEDTETYSNIVNPSTITLATPTSAAADVVVRTTSDNSDERPQPQIIIYYNNGAGAVPSPSNDVVVGEVEGGDAGQRSVQNFQVVVQPGHGSNTPTVTTLPEVSTVQMVSETAAAAAAVVSEASGTYMAADSNSADPALSGTCPVCGDKLSGKMTISWIAPSLYIGSLGIKKFLNFHSPRRL